VATEHKSLKIEDYAVIGDCQTGALIGRNGSVDWLCLPRFDSPACFAAILGTPENGRWLIAPTGEVRASRRRYQENTLVLETEYETEGGVVAVIDCMPPRTDLPDFVRVIEGKSGSVEMCMELVIRFDYGSLVPWVTRAEEGVVAIGGPDGLRLTTPVKVVGENFHTVAKFTVKAGEKVPFTLTWFPAHHSAPQAKDPVAEIIDAARWWREWAEHCTYQGEWRDDVVRSLIILKALTHAPTGGIVAAVTTSLPEQIGGVRNWDYRYCWLRDATFTLYALITGGYAEEARAWRAWMLRAAAGKPEQICTVYGVMGERRLPELELPWLPGYEKSRPVRIGNAASDQFQLDVIGEVMDSLHVARRVGLEPDEAGWAFQRTLVNFVGSVWDTPDEGIWEVRGPRRHFVHSKMMAWVALDRAVKAIERFRLGGPLDKWREVRDRIHAEVCQKGFDSDLNSFVQYYGAKHVDASLLLMPLIGFLPATDARVLGTVSAIQRHLVQDGFVARYNTDPKIDGLPPGEGAFLACSFWLADNLALQNRHDEAREIFQRLLDIRSDVGLLSESYDLSARRLVGNFPQAFSHVGLVNTARNLTRSGGPAEHRQKS
jgi:GH15 family glucan-1,4-alpha-glucosidase